MDRKYKIYSKKPSSTRLDLDLPSAISGFKKTDISRETGEAGFDYTKEAERILLSKAPAGVIVDDRLEILHFQGQTGPYLEHSPGDASFNVIKMAREGIRLPLRTAIHEAKKQAAPVRNEGLQVKFNGQFKEVNLEVIPLKAPHPGEGHYLILFEDRTASPTREPGTRALPHARGKLRPGQAKRGERKCRSRPIGRGA